MKKNIVILADALRCDYLNDKNTPFLNSLKNNSFYIKKIIPSLGFCERAEILTGKEGIQTGLFTAIEMNKSRSDFVNVVPLFFANFLYNFFDFFLKFFPSNFLFRIKKKAIRITLSIFFPKAKMSAYNIPPRMLNSLSLSEDYKEHSLPNAFNHRSIVDICIDKNIKFNFDAFTALGKKSPLSTDRMRIDNIINNVKNNSDDLYFLYIGILDEKGHEYGPDSVNFKNTLKKFDNDMKLFFSTLKDLSDCNILLIGDHGMSEVTKTLDFLSIVNRTLKENKIAKKDINIFCDSTLGRIWVKNNMLSEKLKNILKNNNDLKANGLILENNDYARLNIPHEPNKYGDIIWVANKGVMITPDYFHGLFPPKGMHGYIPDSDETYGTSILVGSEINNKIKDSAKLSDLNEVIIKDMLRL